MREAVNKCDDGVHARVEVEGKDDELDGVFQFFEASGEIRA